jgi:drug/metabolite transporter (DMT)-like permease
VLAFSDQAADVLQQGQQEELPAAVAAHAADSSAQQGSSLQLELLLQQQEQQEQQAVAAGSGQDISSSQLPQQEALGSMAVPSGCSGDSLECSAVRLQQYQQQLGQRAVGEEDATAAAFADAFGLPREGSSSDSVERSELGLDLQGLQGVSSSSADAEQQSGLQAWQQEVQQELQQVQSLVVQNTAPSSSADSSTWGISGEVYILLACCCYAIATVRLSMLAPGLDPVQLATSKTLTLAAASLVWLLAFETGTEFAAEAAGSASAVGAAVGAADSAAAATAAAGMTAAGVLDQAVAAVQSAWASWQLPPAFDHGQGKLLLFYSALGPGALATVLQTKGQGTVAAAQAQVFYSLTPVWAALLANTCLQGEEMGPLAWVGGGIIIAASIGAAISGSRGSSSSDGSTEA